MLNTTQMVLKIIKLSILLAICLYTGQAKHGFHVEKEGDFLTA